MGNIIFKFHLYKYKLFSFVFVKDYSIDELARYDVPAMINYIVDISAYDKLTYIGFSQG